MSDGFSISGVNQKMCWISHDISSAALPRQQWRNVITYNTIFDLIFEICTIHLICDPIFMQMQWNLKKKVVVVY